MYLTPPDTQNMKKKIFGVPQNFSKIAPEVPWFRYRRYSETSTRYSKTSTENGLVFLGLTSLKSVPSFSGRRNSFRKVALYMCRSLRGGTLFRTLPGRSLHGGDVFFRGKTPKIAENCRISAIFRNFCGKPPLFATFFLQKMGCVRGKYKK